MKLTMLGTGHAMVTEIFNTCFVLSKAGGHFLVDGGGGGRVLTRLKEAGIPWTDIHTIFVTHRHLDHITGIFWFLRIKGQRPSADGRRTVIYGHEEVISILRDAAYRLLDLSEDEMNANGLYLCTVSDGEKKTILDREVTFFDLHAAKVKQFGFSMKLKNGSRMTCCGDEPCTDAGIRYAQDCGYLLHESFCLYRDKDIHHPYRAGHSTVKDAAELAERCHARNLILYHTEDHDPVNRKHTYTEEAKRYYSGTVYVPDDLEVIRIDESGEI